MLCRRLRTAWFAAGISLFAVPVLAAQPSHAMAADTVSALLPASLFKPGETIAEGDLVAVSRAFGDWRMHCEMRLSTKRNICAIEQSVASEGGGLVWRISESQAGGQIVLLSLPSDMLPEKGLHLSFPDLEKTISGKHWQCSATACVAAVPFDDILQAAIRQTKHIGFTYTAHAEDDKVLAQNFPE